MLWMTGSSSFGLIQTLTLLNTICTEVLVRVGWRWRFDMWPRSKVQHFKTCSPVIPKSWHFCFPCHVIQMPHLLVKESGEGLPWWSRAEGLGLIPHQGTGSCMPQWRSCTWQQGSSMPQVRPGTAKFIKKNLERRKPSNRETFWTITTLFWKQYVGAKSLQSYSTLCTPMDCSLPGSSVHGILQARKWEWVAMPSSKGSSQPGDWTRISLSLALAGRFFTTSATWEAPTHARKGQMGSSEFSLSKAITRHPNISPLAWHQRNSSRDSGHSPSPSVIMATMPWCQWRPCGEEKLSSSSSGNEGSPLSKYPESHNVIQKCLSFYWKSFAIRWMRNYLKLNKKKKINRCHHQYDRDAKSILPKILKQPW